MSIYRGAGGASDATDDSTVNAVAGYASAAASSASSAATSATNASNSATAAASSASSAASSASSVATNASNAASSAGLANTYATAASASKDAAAASATTASTKAGQASSSASEAGSSASTAAVHATNASNSASAAAASASDAATSASNAADSAADALAIYGNTTDMNNAVAAAATSAVNAATSAAEADDSRVLAEAAVTGASSYASAAQASANDSQAYAGTSQAYAGASEAFKDSALAAASDANTYATNAGASASDAADSALEAANSAAAAAAVSGSGNGTFVNTPITTNSTVTLSSGTANGVAYLNGSKVLTSGSVLTYNGTTFATTAIGSFTGGVGIAGVGNPSSGQSVEITFGAAGFTGVGRVMSFDRTASVRTPLAFDGSYQQWLISNFEAMRLTSTGLGIGTSSPTNALSVSGNANITGNVTLGDAYTDTVTVNGYMGVGGAGTSSQGLSIVSTALTGAGQIGMSSSITATSAATNNARAFYGKVSTAATAFTVGNVYTIFSDDATKGAGSTITNQHGVYITDQTQGTNNYGITSLVSSGSNKWNIYASGTAANYFAGNVGIGTSSPSAKLHVYKSNQNQLQLQCDDTGQVNINMGGTTTPAKGAIYFSDNSGSMWFNTASTQRMTLDVSGNLLVGKTATGVGTVGFAAKDFIEVTRDGNPSAYFTRLNSDGDLVQFRRSSGSAVGSISVTTTATAYNTSSDYRLKNITGPITTSGAYIDSLNPVEGTWKADGSTFVGLIAHEVQEASRTQVATGVKDGEQMQAMDYSNSELIANLIAEVKSLRARVAALESN